MEFLGEAVNCKPKLDLKVEMGHGVMVLVEMGHGVVGLVETGHGVVKLFEMGHGGVEWVEMNYGGTLGGAHLTGGSKHWFGIHWLG